jgi:TolB-like protein/Tfp pilus assembly protein PilF/predicted Ser/Thr protein kinase
MLLTADTRVSDYRIVRLLGKGGMGEVYLAEDTKLGREVALKVLPADVVSSAARSKRFLQEAKAASRLNHPNAAHVYSFGEWEGGAFMAIEYIAGETLSARIQKGTLAWEELARIGMQLADVLQAAHDLGIVHRDVKSQNVMMGPSGIVKLLDFGLAKLTEPETDTPGSETETQLTAENAVVGSMGYMSPEQALGKPLDRRSDLFSFGIVLYEMAAGRRPFQGANPVEILSKVISTAPDPLSKWNYATPEEMDRIIRKCLEKNPDDRYQSAREIGIDLRAWLGLNTSRGSVTHSRLAVPVVATGMSRRRLALGAAGAVGLAGAGWGVYRYLRPAGPASIAVLPFENDSGAEDAPLSDGLTETLINLIAAAGDVRVISRSAVFRFRKIDDPLAVARQLNAAVMMVGRLRRAQGAINISVEVVDVATAQQLLSRQFSTSLSGFQEAAQQIADLVMTSLGVRRRSAEQPKAHLADGDAHLLYLKGRHALNRRVPDAFAKAQDLFQQAIEADPSYPLPYAGLADVYSLQSGNRPPNDVCPKAKAAALKSIELDPSLSEGHTALGFVQMHYDYAWGAAEASFQRALSLNPSYAPTHSYYARLLTALKRFSEAEDRQKRAIELDPLSPALATALATTYYHSRRYPEAEKTLLAVLADQPKFIQAKSMLGTVRIGMRQYAAAIADLDKCQEWIGEDDYGVVGDWGLAHALNGNREKARDAIRRIELLMGNSYVAPCFLAGPFIGLGENARALDLLEQSVDPDHSWPVYYYGVEPKYDPVRREPRFQKLITRLALPT